MNTNTTTTARSLAVLLVEDNEGDRILAKRAFEKSECINQVVALATAEDALTFLEDAAAQPGAANGSFPDLIFMDLNLPRMSGLEALKQIKENERLRHIPVIIFSSSQAETDVLESYRHYACSYLVKPKSLDDYKKMVESIDWYWFSTAVLPRMSGVSRHT